MYCCVILAGCNRGYENPTDDLLTVQYPRAQSWQLTEGSSDGAIPVDVPLWVHTSENRTALQQIANLFSNQNYQHHLLKNTLYEKGNSMPRGIFIADKEYTFQEFAHLLARSVSAIVSENEETVFSITDVLCLIRSVNEHVPGEFEIQRTHSHYYQIVYKSEDEVIESFKEKWEGFIE